VYYLPRPFSSADLEIMQRLDRLHLGVSLRRFAYAARPAGFAGVQDRPPACEDADAADGIEALYRRPRTTKPEPGHKIHPYCYAYRDHATDQVWAMDITYIPMAHGFVYLAVVLDWRHVASVLRLSITMERPSASRHWRMLSHVTASRQSSTPTRLAVHRWRLTGVLSDNGIAISMDGKGAWRDNVFVERLWKSVKYEEVYLRAYETVGEARGSIGRYLDFYNGRRPHSSLARSHPGSSYFDLLRSARRPNPGRGSTYRREILFRHPGPALIHDP